MPQENKKVTPSTHGNTTVSLYFSDARLAQRIEGVSEITNVSFSGIVERVMKAVIDDLEKKAPKERIFGINVLVQI